MRWTVVLLVVALSGCSESPPADVDDALPEPAGPASMIIQGAGETEQVVCATSPAGRNCYVVRGSTDVRLAGLPSRVEATFTWDTALEPTMRAYILAYDAAGDWSILDSAQPVDGVSPLSVAWDIEPNGSDHYVLHMAGGLREQGQLVALGTAWTVSGTQIG